MFFKNDDGFKSRENFILSCMDSRIDNLSDEFINSAAYLEFSAKYQDTLKKLANLLPSETFALVLELDSLNGKLSSDNQTYFYKQGFFDCRMVYNFLRR
ncbi:hypothetical protein [Ruminiclostridium papyrosolvens]|uniref:Uncharacterized protein n=1 Tax=Ruminiclostridium papyrosolvens C7 TaxID=1330534 RepID=U4QYD9_9FIRM|nr:hypothetical protein [Ruminiclostridium papyrosolvens]EPR09609.1 hypothetical protein L323_15700 [Ruminiclostridium papyrosolvens C7]